MNSKSFLFAASVMSFFSCTVVEDFLIAPPYTDVSKILSLEPGMDQDQLDKALGITPYDIFFLNDGGYLITYNYRIKDRKLEYPNKDSEKDPFLHSEQSHTGGADWYRLDSKRLFVYMEAGKLATFITDDGTKNAEYLVIGMDNLLYLSANNPDSLIGHSHRQIIPIASMIEEDMPTPKKQSLTKTKGKGVLAVAVIAGLVILLATL